MQFMTHTNHVLLMTAHTDTASIILSFCPQSLEAQTMRAIFQDNVSLCNDVTERVVQHFVHCIESHGRHVHYIKFLQTIVKAEGTYIRRCQDLVMAEVGVITHD